MTFFSDFANGLDSYPVDSVAISIVDLVAQAPGVGPSVNANEKWAFQVRVANNGHVNMTDVSLHINGANGALVSTTLAGPYVAGLTFGALTINGGGSQDTVNLFFQAPSGVKPSGTELVNAHIGDWRGNLNHMFDNHTNHAILPKGAFSAQVFPA